jgi:hypothetical protein
MILSAKETALVGLRLDEHRIKYQEVYDEMKDHILSAMEDLRAKGDCREVGVLFNEVVQSQFPGSKPFEGIVRQYRQLYRNRIHRAMWANFRHYLNVKTLPVLLVLSLLGFYLPHDKPMRVMLIIAMVIMSLVPMLYCLVFTRRIRTDKGKTSLLKVYLWWQSGLLMILANLILNSFRTIGREVKGLSFLNPDSYTPAVFMLILGFYFIYGLGCIRMINQEMASIQ